MKGLVARLVLVLALGSGGAVTADAAVPLPFAVGRTVAPTVALAVDSAGAAVVGERASGVRIALTLERVDPDTGAPSGTVASRLWPPLAPATAMDQGAPFADVPLPVGARVRWTLDFVNASDMTLAAGAVVIVQPLPVALRYIVGSGQHADADLLGSGDGLGFGPVGPDNPQRVRELRWVWQRPVAPGDGGRLSFQAVVE